MAKSTEKVKAWRKANPDRARKLRIVERQRNAVRRKEDPEYAERCREAERRYKERHPEQHRFSTYRSVSKRRGLAFDLNMDVFGELVASDCFYCGEPPDPVNGIDRIDNEVGYEEDNVVSCCKRCNWAKGQGTFESFQEWAVRLDERAKSLAKKKA
jgi:hypothetical protein